jgi:hypothetical protein
MHKLEPTRSSRHHLSAVYVNILTGDVTAQVIGGEKQKSADAIGGRPDSSQTYRFAHRFHALGRRCMMKRRVDNARRDGIDSDVSRREIPCQMARQIVHKGLRRAVNARAAAAAVEAGDGSDVDDCAAPAPFHLRYGGLTCLHDRTRIEVEHGIHPLIIGVEKWPPTDERAGIVDQDVEAAEKVRAIFHDPLGLTCGGKVASDELRKPACGSDILRDLLCATRVDTPMHADPGSLCAKCAADGRTYSRAGASDQDRLVCQIADSKHGLPLGSP